MIYNNVLLTAKATADIGLLSELLQEQARRSRLEPGCERFEVYHSDSEPGTFILIEQWQDEAALDAHRAADAFVNLYLPEVVPRVERTPHLCTLLSS